MNGLCRSLRFDPQAAGCLPKYGSSSSTSRRLSRSVLNSIRGPARNCSSVLGRRRWAASLFGPYPDLAWHGKGTATNRFATTFSRLGSRRPPENTRNALEVGSEPVEAKQVALRSCGICGGACVRSGHPDRPPNHIRDLAWVAFFGKRFTLAGERSPAFASCRPATSS